MPNFKKLAKAYEKDAVAVLKELVGKKSVYDGATVSKEAPYGEGVKSALDYLAKVAKGYGFKVDTCDGRCTEITVGEGDGPLVGIYAHADVVPVSGKWDVPPFSGKIVGEGKEAKMVSRGASDDKGPLVAALMALRILKDNNLLNGYRVRLVAGGDEERGSSCLDYYFHTLKKPASDYGFTPDAEFPLIYAEKGIHHAVGTKVINLEPIIAIDGGVVGNAVCDKVIVTIPSDKKFAAFFQTNKIEGEISELGSIMIVTFKGKSAHGSTPELGKNAAAVAFKVLGDFYKNAYLCKLAEIIADCNGKTFGGYSESPELGLSTFNYGIVKYDNHAHKLSVSIDYRYGEAADPEKALASFKEATGMEIAVNGVSKILLHDKKSPLVSTLMKSYRRMTLRLFDKPMAIGGGTYAKEAPNCVAYGGVFLSRPGDIHSPNEYLYLSDLYASIAIYADAIHALGSIKK